MTQKPFTFNAHYCCDARILFLCSARSLLNSRPDQFSLWLCLRLIHAMALISMLLNVGIMCIRAQWAECILHTAQSCIDTVAIHLRAELCDTVFYCCPSTASQLRVRFEWMHRVPSFFLLSFISEVIEFVASRIELEHTERAIGHYFSYFIARKPIIRSCMYLYSKHIPCTYSVWILFRVYFLLVFRFIKTKQKSSSSNYQFHVNRMGKWKIQSTKRQTNFLFFNQRLFCKIGSAQKKGENIAQKKDFLNR